MAAPNVNGRLHLTGVHQKYLPKKYCKHSTLAVSNFVFLNFSALIQTIVDISSFPIPPPS